MHASSYCYPNDLLVKGQDLGADVAPGNAGEATHGPAGGEVGPAIGALESILGELAAGDSAVDGQAQGQDANEASGGKAAGNLGGGGVTEGTELDEGADQEETVGETDLSAAEHGGHTGAVGGQVGQEAGNQGGGGHRGLKHADERIVVQGRDHGLSHGGGGHLADHGHLGHGGEASDAVAQDSGAASLHAHGHGNHGGHSNGLHLV
eukprot:2978151-Pyramimonas_sp.AAC.3